MPNCRFREIILFFDQLPALRLTSVEWNSPELAVELSTLRYARTINVTAATLRFVCVCGFIAVLHPHRGCTKLLSERQWLFVCCVRDILFTGFIVRAQNCGYSIACANWQKIHVCILSYYMVCPTRGRASNRVLFLAMVIPINNAGGKCSFSVCACRDGCYKKTVAIALSFKKRCCKRMSITVPTLIQIIPTIEPFAESR